MGMIRHSRYSKNMALLLHEQMFDLYANEQMFAQKKIKKTFVLVLTNYIYCGIMYLVESDLLVYSLP